MIKRNLLKKFGFFSEEKATAFLEKEGFIILERNYYAKKLGEIDIIASKNGIIHFIEVKSSRVDFDPVYNITPGKLKKIVNSAQYYMKSKKLDCAYSIDALLLRKNEVELLENITM